MLMYLVRHAQSEGNLGRAGASPDPPLTGLGRNQAELTARWLHGEAFAALYASPLTRALETAAPIAQALELPRHVVPDLAETNRSEWNTPKKKTTAGQKGGLRLSEVRARFPGSRFPEGMPLDAAWWEPLAAETRNEAYARAARTLALLKQTHPDPLQPIVVITHGAFGSVLMSTALGSAPTDYNRYSQFNCGITVLACAGEETRLRCLNRVEHLPEALRTDLT